MKFNFSGWKKINEDHHHAMMQNPSGHQVKIVKSALSPKMRGQLAAIPKHEGSLSPKTMAKGGEIENDAYGKECDEDEGVDPRQVDNGFAKGGDIKHYVDGGDVSSDKQDTSAPVTINIGGAGMPQLPSNLLNQQSQNQPSSEQKQAVENPPAGVSSEQIAQMVQQQSKQPQQDTGVESQQSATPVPTVPTPQPQQPDPYGYGQASQAYQEAANQQELGILGESTAQAQQGERDARSYQKAAQFYEGLGRQVQNNTQNIVNEIDNIGKDYLTQQIDPNHYWQDKGTGARVATAIGLILGGIGSGVNGGPNQALQYLNNQIDRDIDAQKANLGKQHSLMSLYLNEFGHLNNAADMARLTHMAVVGAQLQQSAAQTKNQSSIYNAMQQIGALKQQMAPLVQKVATNKTLYDTLSNINGHPELVPQLIQAARASGNDPLAKDIESRYLPGVGVASIPVEPKVREELVARQGLQQAVGRLRDWAKTHSGDLNPSDIAYGHTLALQAQDAYRRANGQGVFREAESKFVNNIVEQDPTKFLNGFRVDPKYKALEDANLSEINNVRRSYGLPQAAAPDHLEGQTAVNPQTGQRIVRRNGQWVPIGQ